MIHFNSIMQDVAALVREMGPPLYRFFLARLPRHLAEEGVQEVFLRTLSSSSFDSEKGAINSFAWGVAIIVQKEHYRKNHQVLEPVAELQEDEDLSPSLRNIAALRTAVNSIEEPERTVFQMLLADLSMAEISRNLNMPEGTVKSHIFRGKEKLKKILIKWGYA